MRFEQLDGFTLDTPVAIITDSRYVFGKKLSEYDELFPNIKNSRMLRSHIMGLWNGPKATGRTKILMRNILGIDLNTVTEEEIEEIKKTEEYKSMGVYPAYDSVKMINGTAVANFIENKQGQQE